MRRRGQLTVLRVRIFGSILVEQYDVFRNPQRGDAEAFGVNRSGFEQSATSHPSVGADKYVRFS